MNAVVFTRLSWVLVGGLPDLLITSQTGDFSRRSLTTCRADQPVISVLHGDPSDEAPPPARSISKRPADPHAPVMRV
jgi:hypothetical protein